MLNRKFLVTTVVVVIICAGIIAGVLYLALDKVGETVQGEAETPTATRVPTPESPVEAPPTQYVPPPGPRGPAPQGMPGNVARPINTDNAEYIQPIPRSQEFLDARRAMVAQGKEPDWTQFEGDELRDLKRVWEKLERKRLHQEEVMRRRGPGHGRGMREPGPPGGLPPTP